jgi:hypothetical protein
MTRSLCLLFAFSVAAASPSPTPARDIAAYQTLGPFLMPDSPNALSPEDRALIKTQMRRFLVDSWQQHRRAQLIVITFTMEGLPVRSAYFIEPDSAGKWRVTVDTVAAVPGVKPSGEHYTVETSTVATLEIVDSSGEKHVRIVSGDQTLLDV